MHSFRLCLRGGAAALALVLGAGAAASSPLLDAAARAETHLGADETVRALEALDEAVAVVWQEAPLTFRQWALVEAAEGYGIYEPRAEAPFRPGETMRVYVEPVGFAYGGAEGLHEVALAADLSIETPGGQVLAEAADMFSVSVPSRNRIREFNVTFSFAVPELAPGPYRAVFTVRDRHSDKTGEIAVPFEVERAP
jgi:hypothetical protein